MDIRSDLMYTESHEWVRFEEGGEALVGLTDFAQSELGDLVFVNLPAVDDALEAGEVMADVESVKAVSDVYSPVSGVIIAVNEEMLDAPQLINEKPYEAWLCRFKDITGKSALMDAAAYEAFIKQ